MAEWFVEEGIGEDRAICLRHGEIVAARLSWPGRLSAGQIVEARLASKLGGSARGLARLEDGSEVLLDRLPRDLTEGGKINVAITRAPVSERGRLKLAQGRVTADDPRPAQPLAESLATEGHSVQVVRRFPTIGWEDLVSEALDGEIAFAGGSLLFAATPAMTLIDIDGALSARDLALASVPPLAAALQRLDLRGSIGIDFPTLEAKADRKAVDEALAAALIDWPHERTAMNGFGFVQIVARLERPSLLHRATFERAAFAARQLLRRAESVMEPGALLLTCHPAVEARLHAEWLGELARRTGREIRLSADASLALESGFAQAIPR